MSYLSSVSLNKISYLSFVVQFISGRNLLNIPKIVCTASKSSSVDLIDAFTFELMERKKNRWKSFKLSESQPQVNAEWTFNLNHKLMYKTADNHSLTRCPDIQNLNNQQLCETIDGAVSCNDIKYLNNILSQCCNLQRIPPSERLIELYSFYSDLGDTKRVTSLKCLCSNDNNFYVLNAKFDHYMAKALCNKGNMEEGMCLFLSVYEHNPFLRMSVNHMVSEIVSETIINKSEASIVILRRNLEVFIEKWNDFAPMVSFWLSCWQSDWFADQRLSEEIFDKYEPLRTLIAGKIPRMCTNLLKQKNEDAVARILQTLLRNELIGPYIKTLRTLFDFRLSQNDIRGCGEIIRNCQTLGLDLGAARHEKYLYILIDEKTEKTVTINTPIKEFQYKF